MFRKQLARNSGGFTVVELLVVIAIIGVLAALITPAVYMAIVSAKQGRIKMEIGNIAMALENYRNEYGEYPPDFSVAEQQDERLSRIQKQNAITDHLARVFRYRPAVRLPVATIPPDAQMLSSDMLSRAQLDALNPQTALYFWLKGFTASPTHPVDPLTDPGERTPWFEFDESRTTIIAPGIRTYYPPGDGTQTPYVYYRAAPSRDISREVSRAGPGLDSSYYGYCDATVWATSRRQQGVDVPGPYYRNLGDSAAQWPSSVPWPDWVPSGARRPTLYQLSQYAEPDKFQIVCAGLDGAFGTGGSRVETGNTLRQLELPLYPDGPYSRAERDNLTNFNEGSTLEDAVP